VQRLRRRGVLRRTEPCVLLRRAGCEQLCDVGRCQGGSIPALQRSLRPLLKSGYQALQIPLTAELLDYARHIRGLDGGAVGCGTP